MEGKRIHKAHQQNPCSNINTVGYGFGLFNIFEAGFQSAEGKKPTWLNKKVSFKQMKSFIMRYEKEILDTRESKEGGKRKEEKKPLRDHSVDGNQQ